MKKEFLTPSMEISVFDQNDVLTTASSQTTNEAVVTDAVSAKLTADTKDAIAKIHLAF